MLEPDLEYVEVPEGQVFKFRDVFTGNVNVGHDQIYANIRKNIRRGLPQVNLYPANDYKMALLCGGPSLEDAKIPKGYKIATVNNTYNWALEHGLKPSVYVQIDGREFNKRFIETPVEGCRYLLHSQVHPSVFDMIKDRDVHIWHTAPLKREARTERDILDKYYMGRWRNVPGGSSAGTRAISLLYFLGIRTLRVYGMDCSIRGKKHHAYAQSENDSDCDSGIVVKVGRRKFRSAMWMASQLDEMLQLAGGYPDDFRLSFEGDGLLQYVVQETAKRGKVPRISMEK